MAFGAEIKRLREHANISVQKIADLIKVDADRWRKWEQKDMTPRKGDADKIEAFFGMDLSEIMELQSIKKFLNAPIEKTGDLDAAIGTTEERLIRIEAHLEVYESALAGLMSEKKADFPKKVGELREQVRAAVNRRLAEQRKKP